MKRPTPDDETLALLDALKRLTDEIEAQQVQVNTLSIARRVVMTQLTEKGVSQRVWADHCGRTPNAFRYAQGKK